MQLIEYLFYRPGPVGPTFDQWGGFLLGAYLALGLATLVFGGLLRLFSARHGLRTRIANRIMLYSSILQGLGLLVLGLRIVNWSFFSMRLFLYGQLIAEVVALGYLWWWLQNRYPDLLAEYEYEERKRAYLPRAAGGTVAARPKAASGRRR